MHFSYFIEGYHSYLIIGFAKFIAKVNDSITFSLLSPCEKTKPKYLSPKGGSKRSEFSDTVI